MANFVTSQLMALRRVLAPLLAALTLACATSHPALLVKAPKPAVIQKADGPTAKPAKKGDDDPFPFLFPFTAAPAKPEHKKQEMGPNEAYVPLLKFTDEVTEKSVNDLIEEIDWANKDGAENIVLEIDTPGGSVDDGFRLSRAIEDSQAPVQCVVDGKAASMGLYILQSCAGRFMTKRSLLMGHEPAMGGIVHGQPTFWKSIATRLKYYHKAMAEHICAKTKIPVPIYLNRTSGGAEAWWGWDDGHDEGMVDRVVASVKKTLEGYRKHSEPPADLAAPSAKH